MKKLSKTMKRLTLGTGVLAVIVLGPYAYSRLASMSRQVTVHSASSDSATPDAPVEIAIACYNIAHGRGLATSNWDGGNAEERKSRLDNIAELLKSLDADVVVLNEVDFDSSWSGSVNQARYLAEQAGYPYRVEQRNLDFRMLFWTWRFGNAILSRHPIVSAKVIDLPAYSEFETAVAGKKRGIYCIIDLNGRKLRVLGVHLSHRSEGVRARSAAMLRDLAANGTLPTVIAGDLNSSPTGFADSLSDKNHGNAIDLLDKSLAFQRRPELSPKVPEELTFHATKPTRVIDWIMIPKAFSFSDYQVVQSTLSDHRPVVATIRFGPDSE